MSSSARSTAQNPRQAATAMRRHVRTVAKVRLLDWEPEDDDDR
jgi:GntR family transcriptional repressor for pyruvate dehydrogenase complex